MVYHSRKIKYVSKIEKYERFCILLFSKFPAKPLKLDRISRSRKKNSKLVDNPILNRQKLQLAITLISK